VGGGVVFNRGNVVARSPGFSGVPPSCLRSVFFYTVFEELPCSDGSSSAGLPLPDHTVYTAAGG